MFEVIDFSSWHEYDGFSAGSGRSEKKWLISDDKKIGVFKYPKSDPKTGEITSEHVSEHLAHQLGEILEISTAELDLGIRNGRIGSMSYLVNKPNESVIEGIHFISGAYPNFNANKMYDSDSQTYYSIDQILETAPSELPKKIWFEMMFFDFLIGNSDRHQSNWAALLEIPTETSIKKEFTQCPLYDNGSSLCSFITNEKAPNYLGKDLMRLEALVDTSSRSLIRIDGSLKSSPTHKEVVSYLLSSFPETHEIATRFIKKLDDNTINSLMDQYPTEILGSDKNKLIRRFLTRKIEILNELLEKGDSTNACTR